MGFMNPILELGTDLFEVICDFLPTYPCLVHMDCSSVVISRRIRRIDRLKHRLDEATSKLDHADRTTIRNRLQATTLSPFDAIDLLSRLHYESVHDYRLQHLIVYGRGNGPLRVAWVARYIFPDEPLERSALRLLDHMDPSLPTPRAHKLLKAFALAWCVINTREVPVSVSDGEFVMSQSRIRLRPLPPLDLAPSLPLSGDDNSDFPANCSEGTRPLPAVSPCALCNRYGCAASAPSPLTVLSIAYAILNLHNAFQRRGHPHTHTPTLAEFRASLERSLRPDRGYVWDTAVDPPDVPTEASARMIAAAARHRHMVDRESATGGAPCPSSVADWWGWRPSSPPRPSQGARAAAPPVLIPTAGPGLGAVASVAPTTPPRPPVRSPVGSDRRGGRVALYWGGADLGPLDGAAAESLLLAAQPPSRHAVGTTAEGSWRAPPPPMLGGRSATPHSDIASRAAERVMRHIQAPTPGAASANVGIEDPGGGRVATIADDSAPAGPGRDLGPPVAVPAAGPPPRGAAAWKGIFKPMQAVHVCKTVPDELIAGVYVAVCGGHRGGEESAPWAVVRMLRDLLST